VSQENVNLVLRVHTAVIQGDLDGLLARVHPKAEYRPATQRALEGEGSVFRGHDGIRRWFGELHELYEDLDAEILEVRDLGDRVVVVFLVRGRGTGSGVTLEQPLAQVVTLREGKVIEIREYFSRDEALEAVGPSEVVGRLLDAFNRDDVDAVLAAFDEGCEIDEPPQMPDSPTAGYRGHNGVREWMGNLRGVGGATFELQAATSSGDALLCELASCGRGRGSDVPIEWTTFAAFDVRHGKITRLRVFLDKAEAVEAVGLLQ
jgi:ketosteroid isomerase-like protein